VPESDMNELGDHLDNYFSKKKLASLNVKEAIKQYDSQDPIIRPDSDIQADPRDKDEFKYTVYSLKSTKKQFDEARLLIREDEDY
jgi:hypothetical protein